MENELKIIQFSLVDDLQPDDLIYVEQIDKNLYKCKHTKLANTYYTIKRLNNQKLLQKKGNFQEITSILNHFQARSSIKCPYFLDYYGYYIDKDSNYYLVFESFSETLKNYLKNQEKNLIKLEIIKTCYISMLLCLSTLQLNKLSYKSLKLHYFAIDEKAQIKIIDLSFAYFLDKQPSISYENYMGEYQRNVFSFGLIMLKLGTLKAFQHKNNEEIIQEKIKAGLNQFKMFYNDIYALSELKDFNHIYDGLIQCLNTETSKRPNFAKLVSDYYIKNQQEWYEMLKTSKKENFIETKKFEKSELYENYQNINIQKCEKFPGLQTILHSGSNPSKRNLIYFLNQKIFKETVSLEFGTECSACNKILKLYDAQYYCYFCKIWFCAECGDKDDYIAKKGSNRLVHPHNLVWINVASKEGMKDIDIYKFGKNLTFDENIQNHKVFATFVGIT